MEWIRFFFVVAVIIIIIIITIAALCSISDIVQSRFRLVYGISTTSNNNTWLRRKLLEAAGRTEKTACCYNITRA